MAFYIKYIKVLYFSIRLWYNIILSLCILLDKPMKTQIVSFENRDDIRLIQSNNDVWFCAKDVCFLLGLSNSSQALSRLDSDEKGLYEVDSHGGNQKTAFVSESGLYSLIFKSKKQEAKAFKKWITSDVLPIIRRTGSFIDDKQKLTTLEKDVIYQNLTNRITALEQVITPAQADLSLMIGLVGERLDSIYNFSAPLKQWKERAVIDIFWTVFPSKESYKVSLERSLALIKRELKKRGCKFLHNNYYVVTPPKNNL